MGISATVSDSVFKVKFDATQAQAQQVFKFYLEKVNKIPEAMQTAQQQKLLAQPNTQAILAGKDPAAEQSKDESKTTCIIELLGVKDISN